MEVVIRVKVRGQKSHLETRIKPGSKDNVREMNAGLALHRAICELMKRIAQLGGGSWEEETHNNA